LGHQASASAWVNRIRERVKPHRSLAGGDLRGDVDAGLRDDPDM
jgi:hypothetical protein